MAEGFKIANAFVEIEAEIDRQQVTGAAGEAGDEAGQAMGDGLVRGVDGRLRDARGRFVKGGGRAGTEMGEAAGRNMGHTIGSVVSGHLPTIFSNPYILGAAALAGAALAPALGAGIAGGLIGGAGLGAIAGGFMLVADSPQIKKASDSLKNRFMDIDTTDLEAKLLAAQERLHAARKTKNKDAIKEAKQDLGTIARELDKAQAFNAKNFSLRDAAKPMIDPFVKALGIFQDSANRIIPKIGAMFDKLAASGAIEGLATGLVALVEGALPGMLSLVEASGPFLKDIGPGLGELGEGMGLFAAQIAAVGPQASMFFNDLFGFLRGQLIMWGGIIATLTRAYASMRNFFTSIPGWVASAGKFFSDLWSGIVAKATPVLAWFQALPGRIGGWISGVVTAVQARGAAILGWFQALPGRIGAFLASLPGRARSLFVTMFDTITTAIGYGIGTVGKIMATMPGRIVLAAASLRERMAGLVMGAWNHARSLFLSGVNAVVGFSVALPGRVYSAAIGLVGRIRSIFTSAKSTASSTASSLVSGVVSTLKTLPGKAAGAVASFASSIGSKLRAAATAAYGIGQDIVQGVINGIGSMVGAAIAAAKRAAGNIVSGMKDALGIGSPSKVMAKEVGRWLLPGVGAGVESTIPAARRAIQSAADSLVPRVPGAASPGLSGHFSGPSGSTNYYFGPGSITIDASSLRSVADLIAMVDRLQVSARAMRPRGVTVGA